jgi:hypothetical protein
MTTLGLYLFGLEKGKKYSKKKLQLTIKKIKDSF